MKLEEFIDDKCLNYHSKDLQFQGGKKAWHVIGTCQDCKHWVESQNAVLHHWCDSGKVCCPEFPNKDFGCIHFGEKG